MRTRTSRQALRALKLCDDKKEFLVIINKDSLALGAPVGDAYLVVLAESGATIGRIRYKIQNKKDKLRRPLRTPPH